MPCCNTFGTPILGPWLGVPSKLIGHVHTPANSPIGLSGPSRCRSFALELPQHRIVDEVGVVRVPTNPTRDEWACRHDAGTSFAKAVENRSHQV